MMPISSNGLNYRNLLFNLDKPINISPEILDEVWPFVDSVYAKLRSEKLQAYACTKHLNADFGRIGSHGQLEKELIAKLSNADIVLTIRDSYIFNVRIKITHPVNNTIVTID